MRKQSQVDLTPFVHDLKKPQESDIETMTTSSKWPWRAGRPP